MMRVYTGQSVFIQLLGNYRYQLLHTGFIVSPIAYYLQTMRQVAVGIGEVWFQLQRGSIGLNRFGNVAGILMDRCQVGMSVSEGRIDLNGPRIALQSALYILHLFQCVTHI